jgi:hypothetical protein
MNSVTITGSGEFSSACDCPVARNPNEELDALEQRIELMVACYVDKMRNELELPYMILTADPSQRKDYGFSFRDIEAKVAWLKDKYEPIRDKIHSGEIPTDDDDFELLFTCYEILWDEDNFVLETHLTGARGDIQSPSCTRIGEVISQLMVADQGGRYRTTIRDYMYEFIDLGEDNLTFGDRIDRYEKLLILEFERDREKRKMLKEKHGVDETRVLIPLLH